MLLLELHPLVYFYIVLLLDLIRPDTSSHVIKKQGSQKENHDRSAKERQFFVGQTVMARNLRPGPDWVPAVIVERTGPLSYIVETNDHIIWKRHVDLLREYSVREDISKGEFDTNTDVDSEIPVIPSTISSNVSNGPVDINLDNNPVLVPATPVEPRYPSRNRRPPDRWGWYM